MEKRPIAAKGMERFHVKSAEENETLQYLLAE